MATPPTPVALDRPPAAAAGSPSAAAPAGKKPPHRDPVREAFETLAFVVALVLMLKLFAAEAFVIPTGSMAETLYGYHKNITCTECGHEFPVNSSNEVEPWDGVRRLVTMATCPNCRHHLSWDRFRVPDPIPRNPDGDRVLVHKGMFHIDSGPTRGDVVVFKFPVDPQVGHTAQNYIKRLWGLGGETLAVWRGDLYLTKSLTYPPGEADPFGRPKYPRPADPRKLWEGPEVSQHSKVRPPYVSDNNDYTYHNAEAALQAFAQARKAGFPAGDGFRPVRKTDAQALAMRRIVYDNDHHSATLTKRGVPPRWQADGPGWDTADHKSFRHSGELSFVRYRHRVPGPPTELGGGEFGTRAVADDWGKSEGGYRDGLFPPSPITNFLGYNAGVEGGPGGPEPKRGVGDFWVGDLMLEVTADVADPAATVVLEVSRGVSRFRATFAGGEVAISRAGPGGRELARRPSGVTTGSYKLRFANVDGRLRVWVGGRAIDFGADADYPPSDTEAAEPLTGALAGGAFAVRPDGHTLQNDVLAPASVGAGGGVTVSALKLWQDTFFTRANEHGPYENPDDPVDTFFVQPGHYLCLGDNSGQSSDSRKWGLVPERLMLGKACVVFFPLDRLGFIR